MKFALTITFAGKTWTFIWGKPTAKSPLIALAGTILTVGVAFSLEV